MGGMGLYMTHGPCKRYGSDVDDRAVSSSAAMPPGRERRRSAGKPATIARKWPSSRATPAGPSVLTEPGSRWRTPSISATGRMLACMHDHVHVHVCMCDTRTRRWHGCGRAGE
jgi:hypothetical protein